MARRPPLPHHHRPAPHQGADGLHPDAEQELQALTGGQSERFAAGTQRAILDALPAHLALLDGNGVIRSVNAAWRRLGEENESSDAEHGVGQNYLTVCDTAVGGGTEGAHEIAAGLRGVLSGALPSFALEYTCHAPAVARWFHVMITPMRDEHVSGAVVMHVDVSDRRIAEHDPEVSRSLQAIAARSGRIGGWSAQIPSFEIQWSPEVLVIHDRSPGGHPDPLEAFGDFSPESREQLQRAFETCTSTKKPFDLELERAPCPPASAAPCASSGSRRWMPPVSSGPSAAPRRTSRSRSRWSSSSCAPSAWRASAPWPAASPTTSTTR